MTLKAIRDLMKYLVNTGYTAAKARQSVMDMLRHDKPAPALGSYIMYFTLSSIYTEFKKMITEYQKLA